MKIVVSSFVRKRHYQLEGRGVALYELKNVSCSLVNNVF
jgi:hypothetical protein